MNILYGFLIFIHVVVSVVMVVAILMQRAKGGGLAGIAGGAASQAVFGGRGAATLIHKATIVLAIVFGVNAILLGVLSGYVAHEDSGTRAALEQELNQLQLYMEGGELPSATEDAPALPATGGAGETQE